MLLLNTNPTIPRLSHSYSCCSLKNLLGENKVSRNGAVSTQAETRLDIKHSKARTHTGLNSSKLLKPKDKAAGRNLNMEVKSKQSHPWHMSGLIGREHQGKVWLRTCEGFIGFRSVVVVV
jgi:hypothetical protein